MKDEIFIVILDRSWAFVGRRIKMNDNEYKLSNCSCIRKWGTTSGIGEISINGPTENTILDKSNNLHIPLHSIVFWIECDQEKWEKYV